MQPTRRELLRATSAAGVFVAAASTGATAGADDGDEIAAPFDKVPTIDEPSEWERENAAKLYPPEAVPESGPVPDPLHAHTVERELVVPEWAVEAVRWRLADLDGDGDEVTRTDIEERLAEYAHVRERFVLPDGRDAAAMLLDERDDTEAASGGDS